MIFSKRIFKTSIFSIAFMLVLFLLPTTQGQAQYRVFTNGLLGNGLVLSIDDAQQRRNWMSNQGQAIKMTYPGGLPWGVVFITLGNPFPDSQYDKRKSVDLSGYKTMSVEMKGKKGDEIVAIGMKDNTDISNGSETKINQSVTNEWQTYTFDLKKFDTCELSKTHLLIEFVFGFEAATVSFRNVQIQ